MFVLQTIMLVLIIKVIKYEPSVIRVCPLGVHINITARESHTNCSCTINNIIYCGSDYAALSV